MSVSVGVGKLITLPGSLLCFILLFFNFLQSFKIGRLIPLRPLLISEAHFILFLFSHESGVGLSKAQIMNSEYETF